MIVWVLLGLSLVIVGGIVTVDYYAQHQPAAVAHPSFPAGLHRQGPVCIGRYDDGVGVSWPAVNGLC